MMINRITLLLFIGMASGQNNDALSKDEVMSRAFEEAEKENKHIILIFHTNWCDYCKMYIDAFSTEESKIFFDRSYIITSLIPMGNENIKNEGAMSYFNNLLDNDNLGFPYTFILDSEGNKLEEYSGYPTSLERINSLISILNKFSTLEKEENELYLDYLAEYFMIMD